MLSNGLLEYIYTIALTLSVAGTICGIVLNRKAIGAVLKASGFKRFDILLALVGVLVFLAIELYLVKPTQLLFFDDAIYQSMALHLLHQGQAWMCNYGTPSGCISGQIFHEPIGLSFNIAISYAILGVTRSAAYIAGLVLAAFSVFMSFFVAQLIFKDKRASLATALIMAVSPILLIWAMPTNSDIATLAYSLISAFLLIILIRKKSSLSLFTFLMSLSALLFMKVDAIIYIPIFAALLFVFDDAGIIKSIKKDCKLLIGNILNVKMLIVLLIAIILIYPSLLFVFSNSQSDGYGYQGTSIQLTCQSPVAYMVANGILNTQNFKANICSNLGFWINSFRSQYIIQPIYITALAILGAILLIVRRRSHQFLGLAIWFGIVFLFYTAFYAGAVTYGVDWRFMLGTTAQVALLGGFAIASAGELVEAAVKKRFKRPSKPMILGIAVSALLVFGLIYTVYINAPLLSINPSQIQQAGNARFYENLVYNSSYLIPSNCLVYSYDPTLFLINNRSSAQLSNLYNPQFTAAASQNFSCSVVDIGYWCYTPGNICSQAQSQYNLTPIATGTYPQQGETYGLYLIKNST